MKLSDQYEIINRFCSTAPVKLTELAMALGVSVRRSFLDDSMSGMLERLPAGDYRITVNATHRITRQRFTIAHELGHFMLHRHLVGDGIDDNKAYRSTQEGLYHNTSIGPKQETEANRFAANILMPRQVLDAEKSKEGATVSSLARLFEVSKQTMSIRLGIPYETTQSPNRK